VGTRRAGDADWPGIWPLWQAAVADGDTYLWNPETTEVAAGAAWMLPPPAEVWVVEDETDPTMPVVIGTARLAPNLPDQGSHVAHAVFMADPDLDEIEIIHILADHVIDRATDLGYRAMQFNEVPTTNSRLVALWRSLAFRVVGTVPAAFQHPRLGDVDLYVMHRFLPWQSSGIRW
jgi:hypothetical protein